MSTTPTEPYGIDEEQLPVQSVVWNQGQDVYLQNSNMIINPKRLKNVPKIRDLRLAANDPEQVLTDCRSIEGWMDVLARLIKAAWGDKDGEVPVQFTHDFALIPKDPTSLKGVIIVWSVVSQVPHLYQNRTGGDYRERKPKVRQVVSKKADVVTPTNTGRVGVATPVGAGSHWVWGQSMDVVMQFTVYADSYKRKFEYVEKFLDLMTTYTGIFIQTGLQQLFFRGILQEALYDPPHNEEFPNQSILYDVQIERQTKVDYAVVEQILIEAGVFNPLNDASTDQLVVTVSGIPISPILPNSSTES